jgi:two-component system, OmpR family, sensor kinase
VRAERGPQDLKLLETLERLLEIPAADLRVALSDATDLVASALRADKVDAFLYDASRDSLVALGSSHQPLSAYERRHGLDVLPIANGGRVVHVFKTGETFWTGRLEEDPEELRGVKEVLQIRSKLGVPLKVAGSVRGVMMIASTKPDFFTQEDVRFAESVARWVGIVAHRAELVEEIARNAVERGRRAVAEELVTVLAHDLRNYLSPIETRATLLRRRADREKRQADLRDLDAVLKALARVVGLITEMLDVARIDQGVFQIDLQPVDLVAVVQEAASGLSTPEQPVNVTASEEVMVTADPARIRQCVENLLSNATKHSPRNAAVTVTLGRETRDEREWARIDVIDEGPGIPAELLPSIFDRFVTGHRRAGGLGLGLYLAKRIAVMHGGDLTVDSPPGKGARFTVALPCE